MWRWAIALTVVIRVVWRCCGRGRIGANFREGVEDEWGDGKGGLKGFHHAMFVSARKVRLLWQI